LAQYLQTQADSISSKLNNYDKVDDSFLNDIRALEEVISKLRNQRDYLKNYRDNDDGDKITLD
jgi:hypothetical protein